MQAFFDLCDTTERAQEVLIALETGAAKDQETSLQVICLELLLNTAMQALEMTQDAPTQAPRIQRLKRNRSKPPRVFSE